MEDRVYTDYRSRLEAQLQEAYRSFDNAILTLSGGALALSMGFIKDVVHLQNAHWIWLIVISWVCFALAVASIVGSFLLSQEAFHAQIYNTEQHTVDEVPLGELSNSYATWVKRMNITAAMLWFVGVIMTIVFVYRNTMHGGGQ